MLADLTLLQKLWNKGVDILSGVIISTISAGIVAGIGLLFWKGKLWLDEQRQRQELQIAAEFETERLERELQALRDRLSRERDGFVETATGAKSCQALAHLWDNFLAWMEKHDLQHLPGNQATLTTHRAWSSGLRSGTNANLKQFANEMVGLIQDIELP